MVNHCVSCKTFIKDIYFSLTYILYHIFFILSIENYYFLSTFFYLHFFSLTYIIILQFNFEVKKKLTKEILRKNFLKSQDIFYTNFTKKFSLKVLTNAAPIWYNKGLGVGGWHEQTFAQTLLFYYTTKKFLFQDLTRKNFEKIL